VVATAALVLPGALVATPAAADPGGSVAGRTAAAATGEIVLSSVSPTVVGPGADLVVTGSVRNTSARPLTRPVVRVVLGAADVDSSREAVQEWAGQTGPARGTLIGQARVAGTIDPGASGAFRVTVKDLASLGRQGTYGALPISVESAGASVRTFAGYQREKQYQPLSLAWAVPLTLDPDPDLFGAPGSSRESAWERALGADSRLRRVVDATLGASVTWAIDPTLTPTLLEEFADFGTGRENEESLRTATQQRIVASAVPHTPWVLPDADADLAAVVGTGQGDALMRTFVQRSTAVAEALGGRSDVAWPIDGAYTASRESGLRRVFRRPALAGQVISGSVLGDRGETPVAAQRSETGLPLLAYDDALSTLLARTTSAAEGVLSTQQFVADSAALLNELPGTEGRTVLVVAPRSWNPAPEAAGGFLAAATAIPWLTPTSTTAELALARRAPQTVTAPVTRPATPSPGGRPVLTTARLRALDQTIRTVRGVATIRDDGDEFAQTWSRAAEQLTSTRWRSAPTAWNTLNGRVGQAAAQTTTAVKVAAGTINFLADSGRLQITVTNDLEVPVENVKLTVEASNPRLRIDSQPAVLRIGPRSRAVVNVGVTALAAGPVPLRTTLTTPDGTVVGQGADVQVRVTPTGDWVYWVLGGFAGLILLLGLVRTFRHRPARRVATAPVTTAGQS
jgi:hypothetical protein